MRSVFFFFVTLGIALCCGSKLQAALPAMEGVVNIQAPNGDVFSTPITLTIPPEWTPLVLKVRGGEVAATAFQTTKQGDRNTLAMSFSHLPHDVKGTVLVFKGDYVSQAPGRFWGEILSANVAVAPTVEGHKAMIQRLLSGAAAANEFTHRGSFYLSNGKVQVSVGKPGKLPVYHTSSGDPNNPCPNGPCWSTGGGGRRPEYYRGGPIQNPGRPSQAAGFMRNVPYAWTREAQIQGQMVGIARARMINENIAAYANPRFGYGFFWLWR
jgi:hypothetical protein